MVANQTSKPPSGPNPPAGVKVEFLGDIAAVVFTFPNDRTRLTWCDGQWTMEARRRDGGPWTVMPARGVPHAATMTEARRVGAAFLTDVFSQAGE